MAEPNGAGDAQQFPDDLLSAASNLPTSKFELIDDSPDGPNEPAADEPDQSLADAQEDEQLESEQQADASDGMRLYDFAKAAGWTLDEFYSTVRIPVDGVDVPIGQALNDIKSVRSQVDALSRERNELQEKLSQAATTVPAMQDHSPEALAMLRDAQQLEQYLLTHDWSQYDQAAAASEQIRIKTMVDQNRMAASQKESEYQQNRQVSIEKAMEERDRKMRSRNPTWSDPSVRSKELQQMYDVGKTFGFSRREVDSTDDRSQQMLLELTRLKMKEAQIKSGAKQIRKVGRTLGTGSRAGLPNDKKSLKEVAKEVRDAAGNQEELSKIRQTRDLGPLPGAKQFYPGESR